MPEYKKTNHHLTICSANYLRLKKIMFNFKKKSQRLRKNDVNKSDAILIARFFSETGFKDYLK